LPDSIGYVWGVLGSFFGEIGELRFRVLGKPPKAPLGGNKLG